MLRSILVIKLGALGDIILSFEAFHAIRAHHPGARIVLLTRPAFAGLTKRMPWFDEVWSDEGPKMWRVGRVLALRKRLADGQFDRVYDLQGNDRTRFYFRLMTGRRPAEWCGPVKGATFTYPDLRYAQVHATERALRAIATAGVPSAGPADMSWLTAPVNALGLPKNFVAFVPGCAAHRPYKRWPAERYAGLAKRLHARGISVVLVGAEADRESIEAIHAAAPETVNLCGKTGIGQIAELARHARGVVGNDTGPVHILAAAGAPTLVVMSKVTNPVTMIPRGQAVGFIKKDNITDITVDEAEVAMLLRDEPIQKSS